MSEHKDPFQITPQHFPLYGFAYTSDDPERPNQVGPLSVVVGWFDDTNPDGFTRVLVPVLVPLGFPMGTGAKFNILEDAGRLVSLFATEAEAELAHQEAHRMDTWDAAGFDLAEAGGTDGTG